MTLTKEKSNTHKQHKLPNDERPVKGSNEHETHFRQISTDVKNGIRSSYVRRLMRHSCDMALTHQAK